MVGAPILFWDHGLHDALLTRITSPDPSDLHANTRKQRPEVVVESLPPGEANHHDQVRRRLDDGGALRRDDVVLDQDPAVARDHGRLEREKHLPALVVGPVVEL